MRITIPGYFIVAMIALWLICTLHSAQQAPQKVSLCPNGQRARLVDAFVEGSGDYDIAVTCVKKR